LPHLDKYKDKPLAPLDRATGGDDTPAEVRDQFAGLLSTLKVQLPEVADVRLTARLTDSASCLLANEDGPSAHLERLLRRAGEFTPESKRVLELNPDHPAVAAVLKLYTADAGDTRVAKFGRLLFEQAVLAEGSRLPDPVGFASRINELLVLAAQPA
jgi:molecular chaperone HtpG